MNATNSNTNPPVRLAFVDPAAAPLAQVVEHILERFHVFEHAEMGRLPQLFGAVVSGKGGPAHPELAEAQRVFSGLVSELNGHFDKEEQILLPCIASLDPAGGRGSVRSPFGSIEGPVRVMQMEHDSAKQAMARIEELTGGFALPATSDASLRALLDGLRIFIDDVHAHIAYEDVVFPRAVEVEQASETRPRT